VIVRPATSDDAEAMAHVHTASSEVAYAHVLEPDPGEYERRLGVWRDVLAGAHDSFVAEARDTIVGVLSLSPPELRVIYVHPDWWGSTAGQLLIDRAHEVLASHGDEGVLTVLADNPRARRFYERNGWELVEQLTEPHFGGRPTDVCRYRKSFSSSRS
jgi:GNAT superfamily N-acetyltransferase